jgi:hypothetical protein
MSEPIKHECGIAFIRLLKPLEYYQMKYGTWQYGLQKLFLLMEKQHNRGQEGAGIACIKLDMKPGQSTLTGSGQLVPKLLIIYLTGSTPNMSSIRWKECLIPGGQRTIYRFAVNCIWDIFDTVQQAKKGCNIFILFYDAIIGSPVIFVCVVILI